MSDISPRLRHERIHREASDKIWDNGNWKVTPLSEYHLENMVVVFKRRKFPDRIMVSIDALDVGYVPDFDDKNLWF
jgi:hypothetical protein